VDTIFWRLIEPVLENNLFKDSELKPLS
jgi:hypothetical protein